MKTNNIISIKDKLPSTEGSYLVYAPKSFPKNSRWLVAEYYVDVKGFYSESSEIFLDDVTHWTELPDEPSENKKHICHEASHIECSCKDKCLRNINNY